MFSGDWEFENSHRVVYGEDMVFVRRCEKCAAFVKQPKTVKVNEETGLSPEPHTTCWRCGPTRMVFEGFF